MADKNAFYLMLVARAIYALLLFYITFTHGLWVALFHWIIFFGSLFIPLLGRKNNQYYYVDALAMLVFISSVIVGETVGFDRGFLDTDKILHFGGGMVLALFASVFYKPHIKKRWILVTTIILFTLAVGATWELFEWVFFILPDGLSGGFSPYFLSDSMMDLVMDTAGGVVMTLLRWRYV